MLGSKVDGRFSCLSLLPNHFRRSLHACCFLLGVSSSLTLARGIAFSRLLLQLLLSLLAGFAFRPC